MITVSICDDDKEFLKKLSGKVKQQLDSFGADCEIRTYSDDMIIVEKIADTDIVFLDIDMPKINGFEIAEGIYKGDRPLIIFVTMHDELVYSSIKFRPFRFIRKTHIDEELSEAVGAAVRYITDKSAAQKLNVPTGDSETAVNINDITYLEVLGHDVLIHLANSKQHIKSYGTLLSFENQLINRGFIRTHKSFLVNLKYIYSIDSKDIILDDKTVIPMSRYKAESVKEKWGEYLRKGI